MTTRRDILHRLIAVASPLYGDMEAWQIAEMILCAKGGITRGELLTEPMRELTAEWLDAVGADLAAWRPVQYIIGSAEFCGLDIKVREGVLIPRPETEELVDMVRREVRADARLLDVGTGSGCIAVALASMLPASDVYAMDISREALAVAEENCRLHAPRVRLVEGDALGGFASQFGCRFDAIVSNPPYIPRSDRESMRANVTEHEPHSALFVDDDDPLVFYRSIAREGWQLLVEGGRLYFEIYEHAADALCRMLSDMNYSEIGCFTDFRGKQRIVCATKISTER